MATPGPPSEFAHDLPLGKATPVPTEYAPQILFPIERARGRASLRLPEEMHGVDAPAAMDVYSLQNPDTRN